jgi:hypothetical protein
MAARWIYDLIIGNVLKLAAGAVGAPAQTFGDPTTGAYRSAADEYAIACAGVQRLKASADGLAVTGGGVFSATTTTDTDLLAVRRTSDINHGSKIVITRSRTTGSTTADGDYLGEVDFQGTNAAAPPVKIRGAMLVSKQIGSAGVDYIGARIEVWTGTNAAPPALRLVIKSTGEAEFSGPLAVNGATAAAKPTVSGSRGGNAALADLLTKLAAMGFIVDGTS